MFEDLQSLIDNVYFSWIDRQTLRWTPVTRT